MLVSAAPQAKSVGTVSPAAMRAPAILQRCGGIQCPAGTCAHDDTNRMSVRRTAADGQPAHGVPRLVRDVLSSPGRPLEPAVLRRIPSAGHDLSKVRIHDGAQAGRAAQSVHAHAFTVGSHIVFGDGRFDPSSRAGLKLFTHELVHVRQQRGASPSDPARTALEVGRIDDPLEAEADAIASHPGSVGQGAIGPASLGPAAPLQRQWTGGGGDFGGGGASGSWDEPSGTAAAEDVSVVEMSCDTNSIVFHRAGGDARYRLTVCDLTPGEYTATVRIRGDDVDFLLGESVPAGLRFRFRYRIEPGQENPTTFLVNGGRIRIVVAGAGPTAAATGPLVCSRPLDFPRWTGLRNFRHAFINDPPANYAIRWLVSGNGLKGCALATDASPAPDVVATSTCKRCDPAPGSSLADLSNCLQSTHSAYPSPNLYRNLPDPKDGWRHGPNSNSYAAAMARCCNNFSPSGLGILPGWNHRPADPCPAAPSSSGGPSEDEPATGPATEPGPRDAGAPLPGGLPSPSGEDAAPTNLHAFGNTTKPRDPRLGIDIDPNPDGVTVGPEPKTPPWPNGASTFGDPDKAPLSGHYHQIVAGTRMAEGLQVMADGRDVGGPHGETHHTIFPIRSMPFPELVSKFQGLGWTYAGKK